MNIFEMMDLERNYQYPNQGGPAQTFPLGPDPMPYDPQSLMNIDPSRGDFRQYEQYQQPTPFAPVELQSPGNENMSLLSMNNPIDGMDPSLFEPQPPNPYAIPKDVSGFANYGMEAPPLPDPTQQIGGLMKLAIGSNIAGNQSQGQLPPRGSLMAYLQSLSGA